MLSLLRAMRLMPDQQTVKPPRRHGPKKVEPGDRVPLPVFMYDRHRTMLDELDLTIANSRSYAIRTLIEQAWNAQKRRYQRLARKEEANAPHQP